MIIIIICLSWFLPVNNAAMNYESPVYFCEADKEKSDAIIKVNIQTLTDLTHLVLPKMVAR